MITDEPTEAQIEAAAEALRGDALLCHMNESAVPFEVLARAALVAAQGAAPQAEAYDHCCQHPKCPGGSLCCCVSEQRLRDCWNQWWEEIAGDSKQAFRDGYQAGQNDPAPWLTSPVLPSSGVDEVRAEAVREVARYINRIAPNGLVPKKMILADVEFAADRLGRGIHANGNDRAVQGGESRGE